jgi:hypothetical protein
MPRLQAVDAGLSSIEHPLEDITATRAIRTVILRGTVHERDDLDRMLSEAQAKVAAWNAEAAK